MKSQSLAGSRYSLIPQIISMLMIGLLSGGLFGIHLLLLTQAQLILAHPTSPEETPDEMIDSTIGQEFVVQIDSSQSQSLWRDLSLDSWMFPEDSFVNNSCTVESGLSKRQRCRPGNSPCGSGCCGTGNTCCSGRGCCDPGEKCAIRSSGQLGCCPASAKQCSSGGCCSASQNCCVSGCCSTSEKCCGSGCAPISSTCCGSYHCLGGASCCGSRGCYKPATEQCCSSGVACSKDETCCGSGCCLPGALCRNGECFRQVTSTFTFSTATIIPPPPTSIVPPPSSPTATPKATFIFDYQPNKKVTTEKKKRIPLSNKAVLMNMCEGIKNALGAAAQEIQLTRDISGRDARWKVMCKDFCKDALQEFFNLYPELDPADFPEASIMECDEFPFANSKQGGNPLKGTRRCIPRWQNNWQGGKLSRKLANLVDGDDYLVIIEGWDCEKQAPKPKKRDLVAIETLINFEKRENVVTDDLTEEDVYVGFEDSDNALIMTLGTLEPGQYTYSLQLKSGSLSSAFVSDYLGTQFYTSTTSLTSGNGTTNITFQVPQQAYGVGLVAIKSPGDGNISLSYSAVNTPVSSTSLSNDGMATSTGVRSVIALFFLSLYALL